MIGSSIPPSPQGYGRGLEGLIAGETRISDIDGVEGVFVIAATPSRTSSLMRRSKPPAT